MRRRVLLVEDDADARELLTMLLEGQGLDIHAVATTAHAREVLSRRGMDLVLADLFVDVTEEDQAWAAVGELIKLAHPAPVGVITAWALAPGVAVDHGAAFSLHKPVSMTAILAAVGCVLGASEVSAADEACLRAYFGALESKDWAALVACCTEDVVYHLPALDPKFGARVVGREAFAAFAERTFRQFENAGFAVGAMRPLPRGALVEYVGSWDAPDGTRQHAPGSILFDLVDGKIREIGVRLDLAPILAHVRATPSFATA